MLIVITLKVNIINIRDTLSHDITDVLYNAFQCSRCRRHRTVRVGCNRGKRQTHHFDGSPTLTRCRRALSAGAELHDHDTLFRRCRGKLR